MRRRQRPPPMWALVVFPLGAGAFVAMLLWGVIHGL